MDKLARKFPSTLPGKPNNAYARLSGPNRRRECGSFAVMTPALLILLLTMTGFAYSLSMMYNRKAEVQTAAESLALAAARQLNGSDAGVRMALLAASTAATNSFYDYNNSSLRWSDDAISFSSAPFGSEWLDAASAQGAGKGANLFYVKIDTSRLSSDVGTVRTIFMDLTPRRISSAYITSAAIAGRTSINVAPLAICAMSETPAQNRGGELVEYGFRRGISYDLMQLNSKGVVPANYLINPVSLPGTAGTSMLGRLDIVRPFVCTGTLAIPSLEGGNLTVEPGFPIESVYPQLNSRFGDTADSCSPASAPPDTNVREFKYSSEFPWMAKMPKSQSADSTTTTSQLLTIADLAPADIPPTTTADMYGPLWVYAKAARYAATEPAGGYAVFGTTNWATLYTPGAPSVRSTPTYPSTPYTSVIDTPAGTRGLGSRRVLNVPLLRCSVPAGSVASAEIIAIGKFFMTVRATKKELYAEFAGVVQKTSLVGQVGLFK